SASDFQSIAIIGPTAKTPLIGGGGSARVAPMRTDSPWAALGRAEASARPTYAVGYDLDGVTVPSSVLPLPVAPPAGGFVRERVGADGVMTDATLDFTGAGALPVGV